MRPDDLAVTMDMNAGRKAMPTTHSGTSGTTASEGQVGGTAVRWRDYAAMRLEDTLGSAMKAGRAYQKPW